MMDLIRLFLVIFIILIPKVDFSLAQESSTSFPILKFLQNENNKPRNRESEIIEIQTPQKRPKTQDFLSDDKDVNNETTLSENSLIPPRVMNIPLREPLYIVIPMTLIYSLIFITGLIGNISTCIVIARTRILHSATNYYLFSLSISDLLLLLSGLPQEMYTIWVRYPYMFGEIFCVIRGLAAETSANATVLTITAFTVERYVAICHPLRSHKLSQLSRVIRIIITIWIVALALALPQAAQFGLVDEVEDGQILMKGAWCSIKRVFIPYSFQISICVFFLIPMTIITILYVRIGLKLRRSHQRGPRNSTNQELTVEPYRYSQSRHSQTHVIRMLVSVVVAFFVCWAPFHTQRLLAMYFRGTNSRTLVAIYDIITHVSGILYFLSTCINPVLYNIMSNKFRQAFKDTLGQVFSSRSRGIHQRSYSAASNRSSRMGIILHHNSQFGQFRSHHHFDTCLNCRHIPSMCSCRGSSGKFIRTYTPAVPISNVDSPGFTRGSLSASPFGNNSPATVTGDVTIPLTGLGPHNPNSQGPAVQVNMINSQLKYESNRHRLLRAFLTRQSQAQQHQTKLLKFIPHNRTPSDPGYGSSGDAAEHRRSLMNRRTKSHELQKQRWKRVGILRGSRSTGSESENSSAGTSCSCSSDVRSLSNSISNSSLQDLDKNEYTGEELANCLAEMANS